jgi:hypothetical protein
VALGKTTEELGARKFVEKIHVFDASKEKKTFEEARKESVRDQGSSSKTRPKVR